MFRTEVFTNQSPLIIDISKQILKKTNVQQEEGGTSSYTGGLGLQEVVKLHTDMQLRE